MHYGIIITESKIKTYEWVPEPSVSRYWCTESKKVNERLLQMATIQQLTIKYQLLNSTGGVRDSE
jgi:RIO-like serine/threonine protein kinase